MCVSVCVCVCVCVCVSSELEWDGDGYIITAVGSRLFSSFVKSDRHG